MFQPGPQKRSTMAVAYALENKGRREKASPVLNNWIPLIILMKLKPHTHIYISYPFLLNIMYSATPYIATYLGFKIFCCCGLFCFSRRPLQIKMPCGHLPVESRCLLLIQVLMHTPGGCHGGSHTWVPVIHMADLALAWHSSGCCKHLRRESVNGKISMSLRQKQIN